MAAWGITFDLTITIPALYWFFVIRTEKARPLSIAPVFMVGTIVAAFLLPCTQQHFLGQLKFVIGPVAEVLLIAALVQRIRKFERSTSSDPYERIAAAVRSLAGEGRVAQIVASEIAVMYYALCCWRRNAEPNARAITFHERNGWGVILFGIVLLIAAEGTAMHLLIGRWNANAAWIWTALDVWAILWLLGDYHALRLRSTTLDDDALRVRYGLRWTLDVPRESILSIGEVTEESQWKQPGILKIAMLDAPKWLITLREPIIAHGIASLTKETRAIALLPDDEEAFRNWAASLTH